MAVIWFGQLFRWVRSLGLGSALEQDALKMCSTSGATEFGAAKLKTIQDDRAGPQQPAQPKHSRQTHCTKGF
ncbi:hypothetical protein AMR42_07125 [Limnothrix sp. PR1529]|nr:hypothetical protein BCR12_01560 [Limnothrix sp. P13C2]PIB14107.1 hypothetical protein AMR42_07125 [Limnothrix sp. PR1529]